MELQENRNEPSGKGKYNEKASMFDCSLTVRSYPKSKYLYFFGRTDSVKSPDSKPQYLSDAFFNSMKGKVKQLRSLLDANRKDKHLQTTTRVKSPQPESKSGLGKQQNSIRLLGCEDRIVLYFTSLRGVRRTFEDCYAVRMIFKGFRVWVDERDISMDIAYRKELQGVLGEKNVSLPQVFIRGELIGGADVMNTMFETGELAKLLRLFPKQKPGFVCEICGDVRFVPCWYCHGSRKVYDKGAGSLTHCFHCNENGLIRCPNCCS